MAIDVSRAIFMPTFSTKQERYQQRQGLIHLAKREIPVRCQQKYLHASGRRCLVLRKILCGSVLKGNRVLFAYQFGSNTQSISLTRPCGFSTLCWRVLAKRRRYTQAPTRTGFHNNALRIVSAHNNGAGESRSFSRTFTLQGIVGKLARLLLCSEVKKK